MAVTGGLVERYKASGVVLTMKVSAAVTEGRLVEVSGPGTVAHAGASSRKVLGVALQTASAVNDLIPVLCFGDVFELISGAAITAGDEVESDANGKVVTRAASGATYVQAEANGARAIVGVAIDNASGADQKIRVLVTGA